MLARYDISPKRSASLLDTFSCIFQGIIPYGAQMLVAISTCAAPAPPPAPLTSSPCCSIPSCCACPACCSSCLTRNKASHFVCLQREPTFSRRWALGVMLLRYLYDAVLWPLSAEIDPYKTGYCRGIRLRRGKCSGTHSARSRRLAPPYSSFRCSSIQCRISLSRLMRLEGFPSRLRPWFSP